MKKYTRNKRAVCLGIAAFSRPENRRHAVGKKTAEKFYATSMYTNHYFPYTSERL